MMQLYRFKGNLLKSALYEYKAIVRCSELPEDLATSDLFVMGHVHLVSNMLNFVGKLIYVVFLKLKKCNRSTVGR